MKTSYQLLAIGLLVATNACQTEPNPVQQTDNVAISNVGTLKKKPFESIDIVFQQYEINTSRDTTIIYPNGSTLAIAKNSFVKANGQPATGTLQIQYRELHNPYEIWLSGIPMAVQNKAQSPQLESAGMLEIHASQNGEALQLQTGKSVKVAMISEQADTNYNLYYLDSVAQNWQETEKNLAVTEMQSSSDKANTDSKQLQAAIEQVREKAAEKLPVQPQVAAPQRYRFHVKLDLSTFPEMKIYDGIEWEYADTKSSNNPINNPWVTDNTWLSMELERTNKKDIYLLTLRDHTRSYSAKVRPVFEAADLADAQAIYDEHFEIYQKYVAKKEAQVLEQQALIAQRKNREQALQTVSRTFEITAMGVWNSDRIISEPNTSYVVNVSFELDKQPCKAVKVYMIDRALNSVYYAYELPRLSFHSEHDNTLLVVTDKGELGIATAKQFEKLGSRTEQHAFQLKKIAFNATDSPEKLRDIINKHLTGKNRI
ncbi:hypothetical protein SAMN05421780_102507 [Flexibacter flexilis DSM 6793]|uniref:Uncharacterized protein n=1 Tax=Flexibacter flexilis DSM 6793 TaxID=927664 RepID=A0A1I1GAQ4_9BACT|nr:hypothetical protein [Flexibacter flexilis]SFC08372.1 hypothetical protein SAMN05421780_102507 [Flexibacter flexilis DSM 6793]